MSDAQDGLSFSGVEDGTRYAAPAPELSELDHLEG